LLGFSVQTIQGRIRLQLPDRALELGGGELMCLESGIVHDVKALEESAFLITVSWPGGSAEERHAMSWSPHQQAQRSFHGCSRDSSREFPN